MPWAFWSEDEPSAVWGCEVPSAQYRKLERTHSNFNLQSNPTNSHITRRKVVKRQDVLLASRNSVARGCPKEEGGEARIYLGIRQVEPPAHGE